MLSLREVLGSNPPLAVYLLIVMKFLISLELVSTITDEVQTPSVLNLSELTVCKFQDSEVQIL